MKKILVIGPRKRIEEFQQLKLENAECTYFDQFYLNLEKIELPLEMLEVPEDEFFLSELNFGSYDLVIDLGLDDHPENLNRYIEEGVKELIGSAVKMSLAEIVAMADYDTEMTLFGINALPTFLSRSLTEMSAYDDTKKERLRELADDLGLQIEIVDDRTGMVTPRIICMIINEACFVLQEGTAGIEDVDRAMRLGTNYPHGPFAWADKIGIINVYEVLENLREDLGEEKYKIAPLLKKYRLKEMAFYN